jgi:hypothetical protein
VVILKAREVITDDVATLAMRFDHQGVTPVSRDILLLRLHYLFEKCLVNATDITNCSDISILQSAFANILDARMVYLNVRFLDESGTVFR